ncbi:MAG TPA: hypothetical protein VEL47_00855 [Myxococcota bacterium]|nr:hypothetical protein [Myxococcota bacterium]
MFYKFISCIFLSIFIFAMGCSDAPNLGQQSYIGAASIGDLVALELNGNRFKISGLVGKLKNTDKSGTLEPKAGFPKHVFTSPEYPDFTLVVTPEAIAYYLKEFGKFVVGVPRKSQNYDTSKISTLYNYVSQDYENVNYGTFRLEKNNQWSVWRKRNGLNLGHNQADFFGTWSDSGQGYIVALVEGSDPKYAGQFTKGEVFAHLMLNTNGLLVIDLVALNGIAVGAPQKVIDPLKAYKTYDVMSPLVDKLYSATVEGNTITVLDNTFDIQYNQPWAGFLTESENRLGHGFKGIVSPDQRTFFGIDRLVDILGYAPGVIFAAIGREGEQP